MSSPSGRLLPGLELLRFGCAVAVLVFHYGHFWYTGTAAPDFRLELMPLYDWFPLRMGYRFGYLGVQVFWAISGYIFYWKYREAIASGRLAGARFFLLRFSRLYPLHVATMLLVALLQLAYAAGPGMGSAFVYGDNGALEFLAQLFLASNWLPSQPWSFNGPIWSVSVEVLAYVVFFVSARLTTSTLLAPALFAAGAAGMLAGVDAAAVHCIAFFHAGACMAQLHPVARRHASQPVLGAALLLVLAALGAVAFALRLHEHPAFDWRIAMLPIAPALVLALAGEWDSPQALNRLASALGNLTYSTYLLQFPVQLLVVTILPATSLVVARASPWMPFAYVAAVLALAALSYRWLEMPAQAALRYRGQAKPVKT